MEISEFADKMDHLIGAFRTGALSEESFWESSFDVFDKVLEARVKKAILESPALSDEAKQAWYPEEFPLC